MVNLSTVINIPESPFKITYQDGVMFLGSCFSDSIGSKMAGLHFDAGVNPFGALYNPLSVASSCRRLMDPQPFAEKDLFQHNGLYHSFAHHGRFSALHADDCLSSINGALSVSAARFARLSYLAVTFGTAFVYRLKSTGQVVANCHKLPEKQFTRERLAARQVVGEWSSLLEDIWRKNASLRVLFTVSPIRHLRDGAHMNQVSKSVLILAEQALAEKYPDKVSYFPAYEIMMDELRDYRFYAEDMIHPSPVATDYIWERFGETYLDEEALALSREISDISKALNHRPHNQHSGAYKQFLSQTLLKIRQLQESKPYIRLREEEKEIASRLQGI